MEIIEQYIQGKNKDQSLCEDGIFVSEDFICVVDGATSKSPRVWQDGKKSGRVAKDLILKQMKKIDAKVNAKEFFDEVNKSISDFYKQNNITSLPYDEKLEASVIAYSKHYNQVWRYGDCQCLVDDINLSADKKIDRINCDFRAMYDNIALATGTTEDEILNDDIGRKAILYVLSRQAVFANNGNSEYGYPVVNGDITNEKFIQIINCKKDSIVILSSDGYPELKSSLSESEKELKRILKEDRLCINTFKSTKGYMKENNSYDDRSYIKFKVKYEN